VLYDQYRDRISFFAVYILEAHPSDVWQMASNLRDNVVFRTPANYEERTVLADTCVRKLGLRFPALVDQFDNSTEKAYTGWPDRIYLIDVNGRIRYKSRPGPFGFKPQELSAALEELAESGSTSFGSAREASDSVKQLP
jgi:type I thyroxine 5'-deiodinase